MSALPTSTLAPVAVRDLTVAYGSRTVLDGIDLLAQPGRRIGLIGENGAGKSTLLRAIHGTLPSHAQVIGTVEAPAERAFLTQEAPFGDKATIADVLATTLQPLREAVTTVERLADRLDDQQHAEAYAAALEHAITHDAWDADRRALVAAEQLGLDRLDHGRTVGSLSGGQRTRLALATLMTVRPTCLLLDEPTNHLDDEAITLLVGFLRDLPGVVLLTSHDRVLLDEVCTDLYDLDPVGPGTDGRGGRRYGGGWTAYAEERAAARRRWEETYAAQQQELDQLRAATRIDNSAIAHNRGPTDNDKFIYYGKGQKVDRTLARRKRDAERRLEEAERTQVRKPPAPLRLSTGLAGASAAGRVITVRDLEVAGRLHLPALDVDAGRLLVTGPNGSGKSTLLGALSGRIAPTAGTIQVAARRVVELTQDPHFADAGASAAATYEAAVGADLAQRRPLRSLGLLHPREHAKPVALLSVGQRRRLALAIAVATEPDLLLLDEPTNHLSLSLVTELEEAIGATPGTVVVASHDRWLRRRWEGEAIDLQR